MEVPKIDSETVAQTVDRNGIRAKFRRFFSWRTRQLLFWSALFETRLSVSHIPDEAVRRNVGYFLVLTTTNDYHETRLWQPTKKNTSASTWSESEGWRLLECSNVCTLPWTKWPRFGVGHNAPGALRWAVEEVGERQAESALEQHRGWSWKLSWTDEQLTEKTQLSARSHCSRAARCMAHPEPQNHETNQTDKRFAKQFSSTVIDATSPAVL